MSKRFVFRSRPLWRLLLYGFLLVWCLVNSQTMAHPMPNSAVLLSIQQTGVRAQLQLPLNELQLAFGHDVAQFPETLVDRLGPELRAYILQHVRPVGPDGRPWRVIVNELAVQPVQQSPSGPYYELTAILLLSPPTGATPRRFSLTYDVITHQLVTHKALVSIRQDWDRSVYAEHPVEVGVIQLDVVNNRIPPLKIDLDEGSLWQGFMGMISLGISHIAGGTDHLLFLLVLLLPAPLLLLAEPGRRFRWGPFGGFRYSLTRLLWIVTAFTLGHSITLVLGALGWVRLPAQPVEILIGVSILVSALHAIRPLFPGKETWIAAGFGLVHGLAFASTLANLSLDSGRMALSILGFNLGIELMQLVVIAVTVPWLIWLSRTPAYRFIRMGGAVLAGIAALAWIVERYQGQSNVLSQWLEHMI